MLRRLAFALSVVATSAALCRPLSAQDRDAICRNIQNRPLKVGQWATYALTGGRNDGTTMRLAVVGSEPHEGTTFYWYEVSLNDPAKGPNGKSIFQVLVPGLGFQASNVRALIMKTGDEPAVRMPDAMVRMMGPRVGNNVAGEIARVCQGMEVVGEDRVTVPAGTFRALHLRDARDSSEAWIKLDLDFAMVKVVMRDGSTMALTGNGGGARSSITEQPKALLGP